MDYIGKIRKNKRRFLGFPSPKTKYQRRKEHTIMDFLFFMKKIKKIKKLNKFKYLHIEEYLNFKKEKDKLSDATLKEKKSIISSFYKRNMLGV